MQHCMMDKRKRKCKEKSWSSLAQLTQLQLTPFFSPLSSFSFFAQYTPFTNPRNRHDPPAIRILIKILAQRAALVLGQHGLVSQAGYWVAERDEVVCRAARVADRALGGGDNEMSDE